MFILDFYYSFIIRLVTEKPSGRYCTLKFSKPCFSRDQSCESGLVLIWNLNLTHVPSSCIIIDFSKQVRSDPFVC